MFCYDRRQRSIKLWLISITVLFLLTFSSIVALANTLQQDSDAPVLMLGQFVHAEANEGDVFIYRLALEGGGNYLLISEDAEQASNFAFAVANSKGEDIANGQDLSAAQMALDPDEYTISFTAKAAAKLSMAVVGDYGQLSDNQEKPGAIFNGSYLQAEDVQSTLYAKLSLPETTYFQRIHLKALGGEGDTFDIQVDNGDLYEFGSSDDEEEQGVQFWSKGGEFNVEIEPTAGGKSLTLIALLGGPAPLLEKGKPTTVEVGGDTPDHIYAIDVAEAGSLITVAATPDSDSVSYQMTVALNPETDIESLYVYGEEAKLSFMAPYAGQYILQLSNNDESAKFKLTANESGLAPELPLNGKLWGKVAAKEDAVYRLQVNNEGDFLLLVLLGNTEDLDLEAQLLDESGEIVHSMSLYGGESAAEMLSQSNAQPGLYEVRVKNQFNRLEGKFVLSSRLESPLDYAGQWAVDAIASSEYGSDNYTALQATGEPNTPIPGDFPTAWASKEADAGEETLELTYETPVNPMAIHIYESNAPGAIVLIEAFNGETETWETLWQGIETSDELSRIFHPDLQSVDFVSNRIRLTLDSASVAGWNEIDAVELIGMPQ